VRYYEEPHLQRVFGQPYAEYCAGVPRWWPRVTPWLDGRGFASSMKQVSGVKAKIDRDAAAPRLSFKYRFVL